MRKEFPVLLSYSRFVQLMPRVSFGLMMFLKSILGRCTGITFVDSTKLIVCHEKRSKRNKTFKDFAAKSCSTMGWFYGFKLHFTINDRGEILSLQLTKGNIDDRKPLPKLAQNLFGKLFVEPDIRVDLLPTQPEKAWFKNVD